MILLEREHLHGTARFVTKSIIYLFIIQKLLNKGQVNKKGSSREKKIYLPAKYKKSKRFEEITKT